jgi:hypothetical protein
MSKTSVGDSSEDLSTELSLPEESSLLWLGPLANLTVDEVVELIAMFAEEQALPLEVSELFRHHEISGAVFETLSDDDMIAMGIYKLGWRRRIEFCRQQLRDHVLSMQQDSSASMHDSHKALASDEPETLSPSQNKSSANNRLPEFEKEVVAARNSSLEEEVSRLKNQVARTEELVAEGELRRDLAEAKLFAIENDIKNIQTFPGAVEECRAEAFESDNAIWMVSFKTKGQRPDRIPTPAGSTLRFQAIPGRNPVDPGQKRVRAKSPLIPPSLWEDGSSRRLIATSQLDSAQTMRRQSRHSCPNDSSPTCGKCCDNPSPRRDEQGYHHEIRKSKRL